MWLVAAGWALQVQLHAVCDNLLIDGIFFRWDRYTKEDGKIYYCTGNAWIGSGRKAILVEGVDLDTFSDSGGSYATDKNHVYFNGQKTPFDRNSFVKLGGSYVKDRTGVYFNHEKFDCDPESFSVIDGQHAQDKNNLYVIVRRVNKEDNSLYFVSKVASPEYKKKFFREREALFKTPNRAAFMHYCMEKEEILVRYLIYTIAYNKGHHEKANSDRLKMCEFVALRLGEPTRSNGRVDRNELSLESLPGKISDVAVLGHLQGVTELDISGNNISDLTPIGRMKHLEKLDVGSNPVKSIAPLRKLQQLEVLDLPGTPELTDLRSLTQMPALRELVLGSGAKELSTLGELDKLERLTLHHIGVENAVTPPLPESLRWLSLKKNGFKQIDSLGALVNLRYLSIDSEPIRDLRAISKLPQLERLSLENLPIDDLSALTALPKLDYLSVHGIRLRHCSPRNEEEIRAGVSCYEKDGRLKSWWKRLLRI